MFKLKNHELPKIVIFNPGKRKRYLLHNLEITNEDLSHTLNKIIGGDSRFTRIKGGIPKFEFA